MKKIIASLLVLATAGFVFAQKAGTSVSKTSSSTQGLFKTDVDNYISLGSWDSVKPETVFGFLGYDTSIGGINFGLSHQFKKFYMAGYFGGALDEFTLSSSTADITGGSKTTTNGTVSKGAGAFDTALLFGFNNMALKASLRYFVTKDNKLKQDSDPVYISNDQDFYVTPAVDFAYKSTLKDWNAIYTADLAFGVNVDKEYSIINKNEVFTDDSFNILYMGGGIGLSKDGKKVSQSISASMENKIYFFPKEVSSQLSGTEYILTTQKGASEYNLILTPAYEVTYPASKTLTLKFGVSSPINMTTFSDAEYYMIDGTKVYNTSRETGFNISTQAALRTALVYQWKPNFSLNAGFGVYAPKVSFYSQTTKMVGATDGKLSEKDSLVSFEMDDTDAYVSWASGFTFTPAKGIVLDASYRILANVFGDDFATDFAQGNATNIWNNINKLLVHNIAIEASVKF